MAWKLVTVGFSGYVRAALWPEQLSERELLIAPRTSPFPFNFLGRVAVY